MGKFIDRTGERYGRLVVLKRSGTSPTGSGAIWRCICDCGIEVDVIGASLKTGNTKSCGNHVIKDLTGKRFGRLLVLELYEIKGYTRIWKCICDCGNYSNIHGGNLLGNKTISCGCFHTEQIRLICTTHGLTNTPIYRIWASMKQRCYDQSNKNYFNYGGRGIEICKRWLHSFESFLADMGERPSPKHSIDRIDNNGNYEPGNCRWATDLEQANNTRKNRLLTVDGETKTMAEFSKDNNLRIGTVHRRLKLGWSHEKAIKTPLRKKLTI